MATPKHPTVTLEQLASAGDLDTVERGLIEHAASSGVAPREELPLCAFVRAADGAVVGGLVGRTVWGWLHIAQLWVAPSHRGRGHGSTLLSSAEAEARRRGCHHAYLDSFDFQAVGFYQRYGYRIFGRLEDFPHGHVRVFVEKSLAAGDDAAQSITPRKLPTPTIAPDDNSAPRFPVSVKGVIIRDSRVVLLRNERDVWELPGGKLERGESPEQCVVREIAEELGLEVSASEILDSWVYEIDPAVQVLIVTYGCVERSEREAVRSDEHQDLVWLPLRDLASARMPEAYKRSVRCWAERRLRQGAGAALSSADPDSPVDAKSRR